MKHNDDVAKVSIQETTKDYSEITYETVLEESSMEETLEVSETDITCFETELTTETEINEVRTSDGSILPLKIDSYSFNSPYRVNPDCNEKIVTISADELSIENLYPLIMVAEMYMGNSEEFALHIESSVMYLDDYVDKWSKIYKEVFTDRLVDSIPKPDYEKDSYIYTLGFFDDAGMGYRADRGVDLSYTQSDWQIEVVSDTEVQLIHQAFYRAFPDLLDDEEVFFKNHKLLNVADDSEHQMRTVDNRSERLETYYYTLLWEDEHWKFDSFSLWY